MEWIYPVLPGWDLLIEIKKIIANIVAWLRE
jgi:hypothetical protein